MPARFYFPSAVHPGVSCLAYSGAYSWGLGRRCLAVHQTSEMMQARSSSGLHVGNRERHKAVLNSKLIELGKGAGRESRFQNPKSLIPPDVEFNDKQGQ